MLRSRVACLAALGAALTTVTPSRDAHACGGCFVPPSESTVVTGHRMALSLSATQTVLWDQIQYAGDPAEFSWVLPVKPGAKIEVASDAWFESLDSATTTSVFAPPVNCVPERRGGFGCGYDDASAASEGAFGPSKEVVVLHKGTVGPYETVTLRSDDPGALNAWLDKNGYEVPDSIQPVIDQYVAESFDFIALKLLPNAGVSQMKPVRVVTPGASPTLPLRMVAAGAGANVGVVLFVLSEGRQQAANFPNGTVPSTSLVWDFARSESNYGEIREAVLAANEGRTWLTSYAKKGTLLGPDPAAARYGVVYSVAGSFTAGIGPDSIAELYYAQGVANGEAGDAAVSDVDCAALAEQRGGSLGRVVDRCPNGEREPCQALAAGEIDAADFRCGALDDLATALVGMHPRDVHLTRLEAFLPTAALATDLVLEPSEGGHVESYVTAAVGLNACNEIGIVVALGPTLRLDRSGSAGSLVGWAVAAGGLLLLGRRRRRER
jgi:hypothetical protein